MNSYDKNGNLVVFVSGSVVGNIKQDNLSLQNLKSQRKRADVVVIKTHCGIQIIEGIKAKAILAKHDLGEYRNHLIWPIRPNKRSRISDIVVFYDKDTLISFYKIGQEATDIKNLGGLPENMEIEFAYFRK